MQKQGEFILFTRDEFKHWLFETGFSRIIKLIQNHHTYIPGYKHFKGDNHFSMLTGMKNSHMARGFDTIAQNLTTFPDGKIAVCRNFNSMPAGIKGANTYGLCIENVGNFDINGDIMTPEHRETILFLNAILSMKFGLFPNENTIVYHHWYDLSTGKRRDGLGQTKSCPGTNFFGGNKVEDAKRNFIPLIVKKIDEINHPKPMVDPKQQTVKIESHEEECKVDKLVQWQIEMGEKALDELAKEGLVNNEDDWKKKLGEHVPNWLFFEMMKRIAEKVK